MILAPIGNNEQQSVNMMFDESACVIIALDKAVYLSDLNLLAIDKKNHYFQNS